MAGRYSIRDLPSGRVQARWYEGKDKRRSATFRNRTEAKKYLDGVSADRHRGVHVPASDSRRTFEEVATKWLRTKTQRPKTIVGYESLLRNHLLPTFGHRAVGSIQTSDIREWFADMDRKGAAPGTIRNAYRVLVPVLARAMEDGCLRMDPTAPIRRNDLPRSRRVEMLFLDAAEVARLAEAAGEQGVVIDFAARTGMRAGEIGALRMKNVDLLRGEVLVVASASEANGVRHETATKTGEDRTVRLPASLVRRLRDYLDGQPSKKPTSYLFTDHRGGDGPLNHGAWYRQVFRPAVLRAGLDPALRFHDLRHTCASLLAAANVPPKAVQKHLGHSSVAVTLDRYTHLYKNTEDDVRDALERAFA